jgi:hypothetical protein
MKKGKQSFEPTKGPVLSSKILNLKKSIQIERKKTLFGQQTTGGKPSENYCSLKITFNR